jgi:hypothetical protein
MRELGRRGGLRGGPARAKKLEAKQRSAIAKEGAAVRWAPVVLTLRQPRDLGELHCFVAQYGNGYARAEKCDPVDVLLQAITACRDDAGLARMLPVFVFRARVELWKEPRRLLAVSAEDACVLGYFLELTCGLGKLDASELLLGLRRKSRAVTKPVTVFRKKLAAPRFSALAASWKLVLSESEGSFASYFEKALGKGRPVFNHMPMLGQHAAL